MMSFQDLYIGLSPYKASAIFALLQALEFDQGIYYPKGGFAKVTESLVNIALKKGAKLHTNCTVMSFAYSDGNEFSNKRHISRIEYVNSSALDNKMQSLDTKLCIVNIDAPRAEELFFSSSSSLSPTPSVRLNKVL